MAEHPTTLSPRADRPVRRLLSPLRRFLEIQSAGGAILFACTVVALVVANSRYADAWHHFWQTRFVVGIGPFVLDKTLEFVVNDVLMTIFFFVVGLEIKREIVDGELNDWRKAALPVMGALGGMIFPALAYFAFHSSGPTMRGWGIPMATDIAFVVGILALFGDRVPASLKIFLLALAIADDIGAVLVIAFAYTEHLAASWLVIGLNGFVVTVVFNYLGVRSTAAYVVVGIGVWLAFFKADVHPTVAGVLFGLLTPVRPLIDLPTLRYAASANLNRLRDETDDPDSGKQRALLGDLAWAAREAVSPLERLEHGLHPAVGFLIMPIFALANAGVAIEPARLLHPVALAVALGLIVGKPVGIFVMCLLAVRMGLARLPAGVTWKHLFAAGCLGGIGFTMAIFVAGLAFPEDQAPDLLAAAKVGTLTGSIISAVVGAGFIFWSSKDD
jgi:NhaA family Na+:H+ antiporter